MTAKLTTKNRLSAIKRAKNGEKVSKICKELGISRTIFYRWLKRYNQSKKKYSALNPKGCLPSNWQSYQKLSPKDRLLALERVGQGEPVAKICKLYNVSRTVFYRWLDRYNKAPEGQKLESLWDKKPIVNKYFNQASEEYSEAVLSAVRNYPELSSHKLVWVLPQVGGRPILGNHGVQNVLRRNNLATYEKRLAYAEGFRKTTFISVIFRAFQILLSFVGTREPSVREFIVKGSFVSAGVLFTGIIFYGLGSLSKVIFHASSFSLSIGMVFSLISLFFGMFFFIYSLKYYLTIAVVLSFSRKEEDDEREQGASFFDKLFGRLPKENGNGNANNSNPYESARGLRPDLSKISLSRNPFVSIHLATYNEKRVIDRLLTAATSMDYENYEIVIVDDSTDESIGLLKKWEKNPRVKVIRRPSREGYKGGALSYALKEMNPKTEFIMIFDADFIPYPDTITQFLKYFQSVAGTLDFQKASSYQPLASGSSSQNQLKVNSLEASGSNIAAVQGYQWHVLNKSENWITRGVRSEYAGSYVIERSGIEIYGGLKQIAGSVYMIRADVIKSIGWGTSITEDFELTLKLYEKGYKVAYTPYIQAPAEAVSTIKRLIRQRMRWAEGHSFNVKKMAARLLFSPHLTLTEKLEFLYLSPYYLQALFFIIGTFFWFVAEVVFQARLPFWTEVWGWSLVLTNMVALPLMNLVGLFLEEAEEKDYIGLLSFVALSYVLVPFQGYAALKGFLEKEEGPWFRTPKTGKITDVFTPGRFYRYIFGILGKKESKEPAGSKVSAYGVHALNLSDSFNFKSNHYLALATSYNPFDKFHVKPKRLKWIGKSFLAILLLISTLITSFAPYAPYIVRPAQAQEGTGSGMIVSPQETSSQSASDSHPSPTPSQPAPATSPTPTSSPSASVSVPATKAAELKTVQTESQIYKNIFKKHIFKVSEDVEMFVSKEELTNLELKLTNINDEEFNLNKEEAYIEDKGVLRLNWTKNFRPGSYRLEVKNKRSNKEYFDDFNWGLLTVNTNKSIYTPSNEVYFQIAALNLNGHVSCDADLTLEITTPSKTEVKPQIIKSGKCDSSSYSDRPDYFAYFNTEEIGTYEVKLINNDLGIEISDSFEAKEFTLFEVEREGPTRIYPPATYEMRIKFKANQDFSGIVEERVPNSFILPPEGPNPNFDKMENSDGTWSLRWYVDWKEGDTDELSYQFIMANFPKNYIFGPLRFKETNLREPIPTPSATPTNIILPSLNLGLVSLDTSSISSSFEGFLTIVTPGPFASSKNSTSEKVQGAKTVDFVKNSLDFISNDLNDLLFDIVSEVFKIVISLSQTLTNIQFPFSFPLFFQIQIPFVDLISSVAFKQAYAESEKEDKVIFTESKGWMIVLDADDNTLNLLKKDIFRNKKIKKLSRESTLFIEAEKNNFKAWEDPVFSIKPIKPDAKLKNLKIKIFNTAKPKLKPIEVDVRESGNGFYIAEIKKPRTFTPGVYRVSVDVEKDHLEENFVWGVLAVNTNKSIYTQGEQVYLQMGALSEYGHTFCNANLSLEVISSSGISEKPEIKKSDTCSYDNVTNQPDYFAWYAVKELGFFRVKLLNQDNGYEIEDFFEARESVAFDIERVGATRINPFAADYKMTIKIKANEDFDGIIREVVPESFEIVGKSAISSNGKKEIEWQANISKGESREVSYVYNAPDISPQFYLLGPLRLASPASGQALFEEARSWQIAADATCTTDISGGNQNWSTTSIWGGACTNTYPGRDANGDIVTIQNSGTSARTITLDVNLTTYTLASITFTAPAGDLILSHGVGNSLTTTGDVTLNQGTGTNDDAVWAIGAQTATVGGNVVINHSSATDSRTVQIRLTTAGVLNINGNLTIGAGDYINKILNISGGTGTTASTGTGTINLAGTNTNAANGNLISGTSGSVFNYNGSAAAQTVVMAWGGGGYNNLYINNTHANGATLNANVTSTNVTGNLRVQSGTLKNGGFAIAGASGKTFQVNGGATFEMSGTSVFPTGFTWFVFSPTSTTKYLQTNAQTVDAQNYGHLSLLPASGTPTFTLEAGTATASGNLTVGDATYNVGLTAATNNTMLDIGANLSIGASSTFTKTTGSGSVVRDFKGGAAQNNATAYADVSDAIYVDSKYIYLAGYENDDLPGAWITTARTQDIKWHIEKREKDTGKLCDGTAGVCGGVQFGTGGVITVNPSSYNDRVSGITGDTDYIYVKGFYCTTAGDCSSANWDYGWRIEKRKNTDGSLCTAAACGTQFGTNGVVTSNPSIYNDTTENDGIAVDSNYLYVVGSCNFDATNCNGVGTMARIEKYNKTTGNICSSVGNCAAGVFGTNGYFLDELSDIDDTFEDIELDSSYIYVTGQCGYNGTMTAGVCYTINNSAYKKGFLEKIDIATGSLVTAFSADGRVFTYPNSTDTAIGSIAQDGSYIYVGGIYNVSGADDAAFLEKYNITTGAICSNTTNCASGQVWNTTGRVAIDINTNSDDAAEGDITISGTSFFIPIGCNYCNSGGGHGTRLDKRNLSDGTLVTTFGNGGSMFIDPSSNSSAASDNFMDSKISGNYIYLSGADGFLGGVNLEIRVEKLDITNSAVSFIGTSASTWTDNNATKSDMGVVYAGNGLEAKTVTLGSSVKATMVSAPASGTLALASSGYTLTLTGSGTYDARPFRVFGTLTQGTNSTVTFTTTTASDIEAVTYFNLNLSPSAAGGPTHNLGWNTSQTLTVQGTFTIGDGTNAVTVDASVNNPTVTITGTFSNSNSGTFTASATGTFTVSDDFTNNGTFTANGGTVTFNDSSKVSVITMDAATSFYGLTISTASKEIDFDNVDQINVTGALTVSGTACGTKVKLYSDSAGNQFDFNVTGTRSVLYADIKDSNAVSSLGAINSLDSGNNTSWVITADACGGTSDGGITAYSFQRKTIYDSTNDVYWRFSYDSTNTNIKVEYNPTPWTTAWTATTAVSQNTVDFSVWNNGTTVYLTYFDTAAYDYMIKKGTLGTTSITWDTTTAGTCTSGNCIALNGSSTSDMYHLGYVTQDSGGNLWVMAQYYDGTNFYTKAVKSTNANDLSVWGTPSNLSSATNTAPNVYGSISSLGSTNMYAAWIRGTAIEGSKYTGTWAAADSIGTGKVGLSNNFSMSSDTNNNLHMAFIDATSLVQYKKYNGTAWDVSSTQISSNGNTNTNVTVSVNTANNDIYVIYIRTSAIAGTIYYAKYTGAAWGVETTTGWAVASTNKHLTSNYSASGRIFAEWTSGSAAPYTLNWNYIIIPERLYFLLGLGIFIPNLLRRRKRKKLNHLYAEKHI